MCTLGSEGDRSGNLLERVRERVQENWLAYFESLGARFHSAGDDKGVAHCPWHKDHDPSLSVFTGNDGRIRWRCRGSCNAKGDIFDAYQRAWRLADGPAGLREAITSLARDYGLETGEKRSGKPPGTVEYAPEPTPGGKSSKRPPGAKVVCRDDYQNLDGSVAYQVRRWEWEKDGKRKKSFQVVRPDPESPGSWIFRDALVGVPRVPFKLPLLARWPDVFLVEGEKCAKAMLAVGAPATCIFGGAGGWAGQGYPKFFGGKRVYFIPDCDEPGQQLLHEAGSELRIAAKLRVIDLPYPPDSKKDIADWIEDQGDIPKKELMVRLQALVKGAKLYEPPVAAPDIHAPAKKAPSETPLAPPPGVEGNGTPLPELPIAEETEVVLDDDDGSEPMEPEWEHPIPFVTEDLPEFPLDAMPYVIRCWARAIALFTQTPADVAGTVGLAVASAAITGKVEVRVSDGHKELVVLYLLVILESGSRKSPVVSAALGPLVAWEVRQREALTPVIRERKEERALIDKRASGIERKIATCKGNFEELRTELLRLRDETDGISVPVMPRIFADDTTTEALGQLMSEHGGAMSIVTAEGGVLDTMAGRYGSRPIANFDLYLKAWSGERCMVDRVTREALLIARPALTMCLNVQPDVLHGMMGNKAFMGRGLTARFLFSVPKSTVGHRDPDPPVVPREVLGAYQDLMTQLVELKPRETAPGKCEPHVIPLSPEARDLVIEHRRSLEVRLRDDGDLEHLREWGSKLNGNMVRIAGLLHLLDNPEAVSGPIGVQAVQAAVQIADYFVHHARAAYGVMGADPALADARFLHGWIRRNALTSFTERDTYRSSSARFKKASDVIAPLAILASHCYIRRRPPPEKRRRGGQPSPTYDVNPALFRDEVEK